MTLQYDNFLKASCLPRCFAGANDHHDFSLVIGLVIYKTLS